MDNFSDLTITIEDGICYAIAHTEKGEQFIASQHSNNFLATQGGARGLDTRIDQDEFDEELLEDYFQEARDFGCKVEL